MKEEEKGKRIERGVRGVRGREGGAYVRDEETVKEALAWSKGSASENSLVV